jgi:AhpD family alkylhydroperoxidase
MRWLEDLVFKHAAPRAVRYLAPLDYRRAAGLAAAVLAQLDEDFVLGPPLTLHLPHPRLFAAVWGMGRECLTVGREGRVTREAVAAAVSQANACPYCVDVHAATLHGLDRHELADAAQAGREPSDERFGGPVRWARATLTPGSEILRRPPLAAADVPQILGTAVCFHYLNRMVNVFLDSSPIPVETGGGRLKRGALRLFGGMIRGRLRRQEVVAGRSLLAPEPGATLPSEFGWAAPNPAVAGSLMCFAAEAEAAGREGVDPVVRALVEQVVHGWDGRAPGLSRTWVERPIAALAESQRPAARLALLTALAAYQVDEAVVAPFRAQTPGDRELVGLTGWASYLAAKRVGGWLQPAGSAP